MQDQSTPAPETRVTGHLQVRGPTGKRKYFASWTDRDGAKRTTTLGYAHVKDSGRRTPRGAIVWRAADGPCPAGHLTPKTAQDALDGILQVARHAPRMARVVAGAPAQTIPTFGNAVEQWLTYLRSEKRRKHSTVRDAGNVARAYLLGHFGADTPLYAVERHEVVVMRGARQHVELREERTDTFDTADVDEFRRELLDTHLSPRTVQKILVLLHGVFKLAKRRKLIATNPSEDAERVTLDDPGTFNILEPVQFESVHRALLGELDERPRDDDGHHAADALDELSDSERATYAAMLATAFYAGLRMGELRDLPWRNVEFERAMIRVESGYTHANRSTPKGKRARSTPMVDVLAQRLATLSTREHFTGADDYVFATIAGERCDDATVRAVFYAALQRAGLGHKRAAVDQQGNPQAPIRVHDLRHSWATWAVNCWPVTAVQSYAGHADIKTTMRYVHHQTKTADAELGGAYLAKALNPVAVPA